MKQPFTDQLSCCESCPRNCRVNRLQDQIGFCRIAADVQISFAGLHFGEEPPISGTRGSGTIFFAGCNLRCVFCQNYQISQEFQSQCMRTLNTKELAYEMLCLQDNGAHNINFVSPSHVVFQMADAIVAAKENGLVIPVVYNSNGYDSVNALQQIRGLVDIYMPDIKYLDNLAGKQFSGVDDYADIVPSIIREMFDQVGNLQLNEKGVALRGLLVRHLVLPGQMENTRKCLRLLVDISPKICVSIMSQYSPLYKACDNPAIDRRLTQAEYDAVLDFALDLGLENAIIQELESQEQCLPDFEQDSPFNF